MTEAEVDIANELMKGCGKKFNWEYKENGDFCSICQEKIFCKECQAKISTQLEANKRFLEFLRDVFTKEKMKEVGVGYENISKDLEVEFPSIVKKISDLQQAIKILENK
jgi:hypothetical protein